MVNPSVCIVGLGFVGLTLAAKFSQKIKVYGLEKSPKVLDQVAAGFAHFHEPGLDNIISNSLKSGNFIPISRIEELEDDVKNFVITVGTPLFDGDIQLESIERAVLEISSRVTKESLIIVRSTVGLGVTRSCVLNFLFRKLGFEPLVAMCPERTVEGRALEELETLPQIVGGSSNEAVERASNLFSVNGCPIEIVSDLETAEVIKLVSNTFRDIQFAFANEVALFSAAAGLDASEIINTSNAGYPRSYVSKPGLTGGPCLEKDPWIFAKSAEKIGVNARLSKAARQTHEQVIQLTMPKIIDLYQKFSHLDKNILIIGIAFKGDPPTSDVRGSMAWELARELRDEMPECDLFCYDPFVSDEAATAMGLKMVSSLELAMQGSKLVIVQNNNKQLMSELNSYLERNPNWTGGIFDFPGLSGIKSSGSAIYSAFGNGRL